VNHYLFDTDTFSLILQNDVNVIRAFVSHLSDRVSVSAITIQEVWNGWAKAISRAKTPDQLALGYSRLTGTLNEVRFWEIVSFTIGAISRYAALKKQKLNVRANDLRIASIALEMGATVVTRNRRDYGRIPGVVIEDWSV
jgi:tRNA(fMet)-specific endonuclease VapC